MADGKCAGRVIGIDIAVEKLLSDGPRISAGGIAEEVGVMIDRIADEGMESIKWSF